MAGPQTPGYGQFTGYAPLPGGAGYNFQTANGANFTAVGQEAEELRKRIDTAQNAAGASGVPVNVGQPPPQQAQVAPPGPSNNFKPLLSTKGGGTIAVREGGDPNNPNDVIVRDPGRAATKGGLQLRNVTSRGGYDLDHERVAQIQESQDDVQASIMKSAAEAAKAAGARQAAFEAARNQANNEAAVMAHENSIKQQRNDELSAKYAAAEKDYLTTPERQKAEREGNKGKTIVETLAQALGALGAGLARTPNFAAQMVASTHEREMRQEEAELRVKKDTKDSLLGRLREEMGSMDLAKTAYRAIKTKESAIALEAAGAKMQDSQQQSTFFQAAAQQNQAHLKWLEQLERGQQGEVDKSLVNVPGSPGRAPSNRRATLDEAKSLQELRAGEAGIAKTEADTGKTRAEIASGGAGGGKLSDTSANALANIASVRTMLPGLTEASRKPAMTGSFLPGSSALSSDISAYEAQAETLARLAGKAVEGDAAAESNVKALTKNLLSPIAHQREAAMNALDGVLAEKERQMTRLVPGAPK